MWQVADGERGDCCSRTVKAYLTKDIWAETGQGQGAKHADPQADAGGTAKSRSVGCLWPHYQRSCRHSVKVPATGWVWGTEKSCILTCQHTCTLLSDCVCLLPTCFHLVMRAVWCRKLSLGSVSELRLPWLAFVGPWIRPSTSLSLVVNGPHSACKTHERFK
jgi:hypothetical protein